MPNWYASYTNCSDPGDWYKQPILQTAVIGIIVASVGIGLIIAGASTTGSAVVLAAAYIAGIYYCNWWLNIRLICLGGDRSAIGVIYDRTGLPDPPYDTLEPPTPSSGFWNLGDYDTDFSFDLLLWPFTLSEEIWPAFIDQSDNGNLTIANANLLMAEWATHSPPGPVPLSPIQVPLILPQAALAGLPIINTGQDVNKLDEPSGPLNPGLQPLKSQHFLLHCEIEGPGMQDLRTFLWVLLTIMVVATVLEASGILSWLSWLLILLAEILSLFIGGPVIQHQVASSPTDGDTGDAINMFDPANPTGQVDILYAYGRWVYDSLHNSDTPPHASNEFHPLHFVIFIEKNVPQSRLAAGNWPTNLEAVKATYDTLFSVINSPSTAATQALPENRWVWHPLLDGCQGMVDHSPSPIPK